MGGSGGRCKWEVQVGGAGGRMKFSEVVASAQIRTLTKQQPHQCSVTGDLLEHPPCSARDLNFKS